VTDLIELLSSALHDGDVEIIDLTHPLSERTPVVPLPPELQQIPPPKIHAGPRYGDQPDAWNWLEIAEHTGTHIDAPIHWFTGRGGQDVSAISPACLVAPCVVIDRTAEASADANYVLGLSDVRAFEAEHGPLPAGGWLLLRTGWGALVSEPERFVGAGPEGLATPGFDPLCARWLADETSLAGVGVETVGIDAGAAACFDPPFPAHHYLLGAGKYGLSQLASLDRLPITGALLVVAPLRLVGGTGSPARVFAFVPQQTKGAPRHEK
jgi:kynurenine formamidase